MVRVQIRLVAASSSGMLVLNQKIAMLVNLLEKKLPGGHDKQPFRADCPPTDRDPGYSPTCHGCVSRVETLVLGKETADAAVATPCIILVRVVASPEKEHTDETGQTTKPRSAGSTISGV